MSSTPVTPPCSLTISQAEVCAYLITNPETTPPTHTLLAFKNALLKPFGGAVGSLGLVPPMHPCMTMQ